MHTMLIKQRVAPSNRCQQRGAVVLVFALTLLVLIGFAGMAIDLGRFFVIKSELQNAMDACALAAASQLSPGQAENPAVLTRAVAYGQVFSTGGAAIQNRVNFQSTALDLNVLEVTFGVTNGPNDASNYKSAAFASSNTARYAKCTYPLAGLPIFFMRVLNPALNTQTVSAMAVATLAPSASNCAIPVGVCKVKDSTAASDPPFGLAVGEWLASKSGAPYGTGNFGWLDFTPPAGGAPELAALLTGSGQCELTSGDRVGEAGNIASLDEAWNTRFGWYKKGGGANDLTLTTAPPDFTGFAYAKENWPNEFNAYSGVPGVNPIVPGAVNFETARVGYRAYQGDTPKGIPSQVYSPSSAAQHLEYGQNRRLAVAPVVDCEVWNTGGAMPAVEGWACILMLNPIGVGTPKSPEVWDVAKLEYRGLSTSITTPSPCSTAGGAGRFGPLVPVLVQ